MMKLAFSEIGWDQNQLKIQGNTWISREFAEIVKSMDVVLNYRLTSEDTAELTGELAGEIRLACDRCGEQVWHQLQESFYYLVTTRKEEISELPERECSDEECDTLYLEESSIDMKELLQEQFLLVTTGKVVCRDECKGLCPECGQSLNSANCACSDVHSDSPFAVLKKLKNN